MPTTCKFVWMPLEPEAAIQPCDDAIRIESPKADGIRVHFPSPETQD